MPVRVRVSSALPFKNINRKIMAEKTVKIKCDCGHKFKVTKNDAVGSEWDFTGPNYYKFECPKCGRNHFVRQYTL